MDRLFKGDLCPSFNTQDFNGNIVKTDNLKGSKWMLSFYRYSECMLCNLRISEIKRYREELKRNGFRLIAVFQSPPEDVQKFIDKQDPFFSVIPDPERKLYKLFKVEEHNAWKLIKSFFSPWKFIVALTHGFLPIIGHGSFTLVPSDFLIDEKGIIQSAFYGKDISDHLSISEVMAFVKA